MGDAENNTSKQHQQTTTPANSNDTSPPQTMSNENDSDDSEAYEPEYEPEQVVVSAKLNLNITLQVLSVVPPPLEYMSTLHSQQQEISGRQVWTGSLLLAHTLCHFYQQQNDLFQDKRILELGSGTGILGMTVSKLGHPCPSCVVLTDGDEKAVALLQDNLVDPFNSIDSSKVKACLLRWGYDQVAGFNDWYRNAYNVSDNSDDNININATDTVKFDCIVAGDVMYKNELPPLFFATVDALLVSGVDGVGTLWLCHVPRATVTHDVVAAAAVKAGFRVETVDLTKIPPVEGCPLEDSSRAKVYRITRQAA